MYRSVFAAGTLPSSFSQFPIIKSRNVLQIQLFHPRLKTRASLPPCAFHNAPLRSFTTHETLFSSGSKINLNLCARVKKCKVSITESVPRRMVLLSSYSTSISSTDQLKTEKEKSKSNGFRRKSDRRRQPRKQLPLVSAAYNGFQRFIPDSIAEKHVVLAEGKARLFKNGNPLVYGGAVDQVSGEPQDGDIVDVVDQKFNFIGWGIYNSKSMYRIRLLCSVFDNEDICRGRDLSLLIDTKIGQAIATRKACNLPNQDTNIFRLIHGEGDRLSGLVIDIYNEIAVVSSSALWCELNKNMIYQLLERKLKAELNVKEIVWRRSESRLLQDGYSNEAEKDEKNNILSDNEKLGQDKQYCIGKENSLQYYISPRSGQKTGFYCDQRENRDFIKSIAKDKNVLDLFSYSGGFAMNALKGGARSVIGVDSSQGAIDTANSNVQLNNLDTNQIQFIREECEKFMERASSSGLKYDIVILDPPKLAPNNRSLPGAIKKYKSLNAAAMKLVKPNGILLSCTCSSAMTLSGEFLKVVSASATEAGRHITVLRQSYAACDHVLNPNYMESTYLSAVAVLVH